MAQQLAGAMSPGTSFTGVEPIGNVHPDADGYQAIADEMAAVPEPATAAMVGLSGMLLAGYGWRRRSAIKSLKGGF